MMFCLSFRLISFCVFFALVFFKPIKTVVAQSGDVPSFVTEDWDSYTRGGKGLYIDLLDEVYGKSGYKIKLLPWKQAQSDFKSGKYDGLVGEDMEQKCRYPKWPIDVNAFASFFNLKKLPKWNRNEASRLKVTWVRGYDLIKFAPEFKPILEVANVEQGIKMVLSGQADVLIDYETDINAALAKLKLKNESYKVEKIDVVAGYISVCYQNNPRGAELVAKHDAALNKAVKEGKFKTIFKKYGFEMYADSIIKFVNK